MEPAQHLDADVAGGVTTPFHALHLAPGPLVLPNAWDVASARLFERAGARAIATASAAVAWSLGSADGERLPLDELIRVVARLARAVRVPLTVDLERGYGAPAWAVGRVVDAGAVGVNLEDASGPPAAFAAQLADVRAKHRDVFINARTCIVLHGRVTRDRLVSEVLARARLYAEAGADGLFVPGVLARADIEAIAMGTSLSACEALLAGDATRLARTRLSYGELDGLFRDQD